MATGNLDEIVKQLSNLKVVDLAKLKKMLEEEWDVSAVAPVAAVAAAPAAAAETEAAAEPTEFNVTLTEAPTDKKISIIKAVREVTGLNLREAKELVENPPKVLKEGIPKAEADEIVKKMEAAGAKTSVVGV